MTDKPFSGHEEILKLNRLLRTIMEINQSMVKAAGGKSLLRDACRILGQRGGFKMSWVALRSTNGKRLTPAAYWGVGEDLAAEVINRLQTGAGASGPTWTAIQMRQPIVYPDVTEDPTIGDWREFCEKYHIRSAAGFPLRYRDEVLGALLVYSSEAHRFGEEEIQLLDELADDLAYALRVIEERRGRKASDRQLRESERRYRLLFEQSLAGVFLTNLSGRVLDCNDAAAKLLGFDRPADLKGRNIREFYADPGRREDLLSELERSGKLSNIPLKLRKRNSETIWVLESVSMFQPEGENEPMLMGTVLDLTRQVEARRRLEQLAAAVEQAPDAIIVADNKARIQYVNSAFTEITGYSRDEALGKGPLFLRHGLVDRNVLKELKTALGKGEGWKGTFENRRRDGRVYADSTALSPVRDDDGNITHYVAVKRDISREKALETKLLQAQKLEALGRLAGGVAHDFNNVLTAITSFAELSLAVDGVPVEVKHHLEEIMRASGRASEIARRLLVFGRPQPVSAARIDLNEVVRSMGTLLERLIGEQVVLKFRSGQGPLAVYADPVQLEQVILNLVVNARDAMPDGGEIAIETAGATVPDAEDGAAPPGSYAVLSVGDTGVGMSPETQDRIFEPFYTTKSLGKGTGLGLATVHGIVRESGGFIRVYSKEGRGTIFKVLFPLAGEDPEPPTDGRFSEAEKHPLRGRCILLVEDERQVREATVEALEALGCRVLAAAGIGEGLALFKAHHHEVDLLLTDMMLPDGTGMELYRELLQFQDPPRAVFMSGYSREEIPREYHADFLPKPFTVSALAAKLREIWRES